MSKVFEEAIKELEEIVGKLERGDASLDESLKLFEEGIGLAQFCQKTLDTAEKKVSVLIENQNGEVEKKDFTGEEE